MSNEQLKGIYDEAICLTEYKELTILERVNLICNESGIKLSTSDWRIFIKLNNN
jgi:hypothetical protein